MLLKFSTNTPSLTLGIETQNTINSSFNLSSNFQNVDSTRTAIEASSSS